jgi:hypothetical protein
LVEAAIKQPPMPLEAPDADETDFYQTGDPQSDQLLNNTTNQIIATLQYQINNILEQLANCQQTNNCEELKQQYIELSRRLQMYRQM